MNFRKIELPYQLLEHPHYSQDISTITIQMYYHIEYLHQLIEKAHQIYSNLSKSINKISNEYQKKLYKYSDAASMCIGTFIRGINSIFNNIQHQVNNNILMLLAKDNKLAKKGKQIIIQKLQIADKQLQQYLQFVKQYNNQGKIYFQKCQYFKDYQQNPLKYYAVGEGNRKYQKIKLRQFELRKKLQNNSKYRKQLQLISRQLRVSIKQYYNLLKNNLQQYRKISHMLRQKLSITRMNNATIIQQISEQADNSFRQRQKSLLRKSDPKQPDLINIRNQKIKIFNKQINLFQLFQTFIYQLGDILIKIVKFIESIKNQDKYLQFINFRKKLNQFLDPQMIQNIDLCINQIQYFRGIFQKIVKLLNKNKIFKEISSIKQYNSQAFYIETQNLFQGQRKDKKLPLYGQYIQIQQKFEGRNSQYVYRYKQFVMTLLVQINKQFESKKPQLNNNKASFNIFDQKYYNILSLPFFTNRQQQQQFQQSIHIKNYLYNIKTNQLQLILQDDNIQNQSRYKSSCCGLRKQKQYISQIDSFNCALKKGIILNQGKIYLHVNFIKFYSFFGGNGLFGQMTLQIPKSDIINIIKDRYIAMMIVIITQHGNIQFTSFFSDPYDLLIKTYPKKQHRSRTRSNRSIKPQLKQIQQKFTTQLDKMLLQKGLILINIKTYPSLDYNQLAISIQYRQRNLLKIQNIQIKLKKLQILQYKLKFDQKCNQKNKQILNQIIKIILNQNKLPKKQTQLDKLQLNPDLQFQLDLKNYSYVSQIPKINKNDNKYCQFFDTSLQPIYQFIQDKKNKHQKKSYKNQQLSVDQHYLKPKKSDKRSSSKISQKSEEQFKNLLESGRFKQDKLQLKQTNDQNYLRKSDVIKKQNQSSKTKVSNNMTIKFSKIESPNGSQNRQSSNSVSHVSSPKKSKIYIETKQKQQKQVQAQTINPLLLILLILIIFSMLSSLFK